MSPDSNRCDQCPAGAGCPFCTLTGEARRSFQSLTEVRCYSPGSHVVHQGERPEGLFIIREGVLRLRHEEEDGRSVVLGLLGPGGLVGLTESVNHSSSRFSVEALQESTLEVVPRAGLVRFLTRFPEAVIPLLVWESEELERRIDELLAARCPRPLPERLMGRLRSMARVCGVAEGDDVVIDLPLTVQAVGDSLGCSRQWASRLLTDAEAEGLVERRRGRIVLKAAGLASTNGG